MCGLFVCVYVCHYVLLCWYYTLVCVCMTWHLNLCPIIIMLPWWPCTQVENTFISSSSHDDILSILKSSINPVKVLAVPQTRRSTSHTHYRYVLFVCMCVCVCTCMRLCMHSCVHVYWCVHRNCTYVCIYYWLKFLPLSYHLHIICPLLYNVLVTDVVVGWQCTSSC